MEKMRSVVRFFRINRTPDLSVLEVYQLQAIRNAGLENRLGDKDFVYSPLFEVPKPVYEAVMSVITLAGQGPIELAGPAILSRYQEKISYSFIEAAYQRLERDNQVPHALVLDQNLFIGTAPVGSLFPRLYYDSLSRHHHILFDAGFLIFLSMIANLIGKQQDQSTAENPSLERILEETATTDIDPGSAEIHSLSEALCGLIVQNAPHAATKSDWLGLERSTVAAEAISDWYTFCLGHELAHVDLGINSDKDTVQLETEADALGLQKALLSRQPKGDNFPCLTATFLLFGVMDLIYRAINFLEFRKDYRQMSAHAMDTVLYPQNRTLYPHPRTRLAVLNNKVKSQYADSRRLDYLEKLIYTFSERIWLQVEPRITNVMLRPSRTWQAEIELHSPAHKTDGGLL